MIGDQVFFLTRFTLFQLTIFVGGILALTSLSFGQSQPQSESQLLENYLVSLQLNDLVVEHLEIEVSREIDLSRRRELASRLVNEYADRMMSKSVLDETDWQSKAKLVLETYPELATTSIRIAIQQSEYLQLESEFRKWWDAGRDPQKQTPLTDRWRDLNQALYILNSKLTEDYEDKAALMQANPQERIAFSQQLQRLELQLLHTEFLSGWSAYFLGVLTPDDRRELMTESDVHFRNFLQIELKQTLTEVSPEWIDFSSDWNSQALVGLAMCQNGLNHPQQSQYCFDLIGKYAANQRMRNLRHAWEFNSRVYLDDFAAGREMVDAFAQSKQASQSSRILFWSSTLSSSIAIRTKAPVVSQHFLRSGLTGLAKEFQGQLLKDFVKQNQIGLGEDDFLSHWVKGLLAFHEAETSANSAKLAEAKKQLRAALAFSDDTYLNKQVVCCEYLLARVQFQQREYEESADTFLRCSIEFDEVSPDLAAESQWLAVRALSELSRTDSQNLIKANRAINGLIRRFPGSTYAKQAEFEKLLINLTNLPTSQAIARLSRFRKNDPNYPLALNEIVKLRYRAWMDVAQSETVQKQAAFSDLINSESNYMTTSGTSLESKLKAQLLVVDAMLRTEKLDVEQIRKRLTSIENVFEKSKTPNSARINVSIYPEFRYYRFLLATKTGDQALATTEANWLTTNASETRFEKSAMIQLAQLSDESLRNQTAPTLDQIKSTAEVFTTLLRVIGSADEDLRSNANARVAILRLAELKLALGAHDEAIEILDHLDKLLPNHKPILRQLALAYTKSEQYSNAVSIWPKLIRGIDPGSESWFEAKYHLAICLAATGSKQEARQLLEQTIRLSSEIPPRWIQPFSNLTNELKLD